MSCSELPLQPLRGLDQWFDGARSYHTCEELIPQNVTEVEMPITPPMWIPQVLDLSCNNSHVSLMNTRLQVALDRGELNTTPGGRHIQDRTIYKIVNKSQS